MVNLLDCSGALLRSTTTNGSGLYLFDNLNAGNYIVEFISPPGLEFTLPDQGSDDTVDSDADPISGRTICITLPPGVTDLTWDAGIFRTPEVLPQVITTTTTAPAATSETLPFTGSSGSGVAGVGIALLTAGGLVLLVVSRRDSFEVDG